MKSSFNEQTNKRTNKHTNDKQQLMNRYIAKGDALCDDVAFPVRSLAGITGWHVSNVSKAREKHNL